MELSKILVSTQAVILSFIDQWLKGARCDILAELMNIGFSRPKFNVHVENHG